MGLIYVYTNIVNGKQYIGKTVRRMNQRHNEHIYDSKNIKYRSIFHNALNKYGTENFELECMEVQDNLIDVWEVDLIKRWNTKKPHGYNINDGGGSNSGWHHSEETKRRMSEFRKDKASPLKGSYRPEEVKRKISESLKGKKHTQETKDLLSARLKGRRFRKETISRMSKAKRKQFIIEHPSGVLEIVDGLRPWLLKNKKYNIHKTGLLRVANGLREDCNGFKCYYCEVN